MYQARSSSARGATRSWPRALANGSRDRYLLSVDERLATVDKVDDHFHEECGVAAVAAHRDAANLVYLTLYALQHRGQESAGIAAWDGSELRQH